MQPIMEELHLILLLDMMTGILRFNLRLKHARVLMLQVLCAVIMK